MGFMPRAPTSIPAQMLGELGVRMQLDWAKTAWFKQPSKQIKNSRFRMSVVLVVVSKNETLLIIIFRHITIFILSIWVE